MNNLLSLGLMSGTSCDGLDVALCRFWQNNNERWNYQLVDSEIFSYNKDIMLQLGAVMDMSALQLALFEVDLSRLWANNVQQFLGKQNQKPDIIAMHGHTVFHQPDKGLTLQIGNGALLAKLCGIPTACDFRRGDIALDGQGAPLTPIGDELLFEQYDACLNLGGFANISYRKNNKRIACDIVPCNIALNFLSAQLLLNYDPAGENSRQGEINFPLLNQLNGLDFYEIGGAKSLGKEWFNLVFLPLLQQSNVSIYDALRTVSEHIAMQIAHHIMLCKATTMLITGGGAKNKFLISLLKEKTGIEIIIPEEKLIDHKEAIIFAFLGVLRLLEQINCLSEVTGAICNSCNGAIYQ